jgi:hypothetical protein
LVQEEGAGRRRILSHPGPALGHLHADLTIPISQLRKWNCARHAGTRSLITSLVQRHAKSRAFIAPWLCCLVSLRAKFWRGGREHREMRRCVDQGSGLAHTGCGRLLTVASSIPVERISIWKCNRQFPNRVSCGSFASTRVEFVRLAASTRPAALSRVVTLMTGCLLCRQWEQPCPLSKMTNSFPNGSSPRARSLHVRDELRDSTPRQLMPRHLRSTHTARHSRYGRVYVGPRFARDRSRRASYGTSAEMLVSPCPFHPQFWAGVQIASCERRHSQRPESQFAPVPTSHVRLSLA